MGEYDRNLSRRAREYNYKGFGDVRALEQAIGALPPIPRDAIRMLKLKEMSLKEAADSLNTTVGALKVCSLIPAFSGERLRRYREEFWCLKHHSELTPLSQYRLFRIGGIR